MRNPVACEDHEFPGLGFVKVLPDAWFVGDAFEPLAFVFRQGSCSPASMIKKSNPSSTGQRCNGFPWKSRQRGAFQQFRNCRNTSSPLIRIRKVGFLLCKFCQSFTSIAVVQPTQHNSKDQNENEDEQKNENPIPSRGWRPQWYGAGDNDIVKALKTCGIGSHRAPAPS